MTDSSLVLLREFDTSVEANLAKSFLESHGITTEVFDENAWILSGIIRIRLMIAKKDYNPANALLEEMEKEGNNG